MGEYNERFGRDMASDVKVLENRMGEFVRKVEEVRDDIE